MKNYIRTGLIAGVIASGAAVGIAQIGTVSAQTDDTPVEDDADASQPADVDRPGRGSEERAEKLAELAALLGIDAEALHEALHSGSTLADVATEQGVAVDTVIDAIVESQTDRINQAVTDGRITQEQADERLANVEERVTTSVNEGRPDRGERGPRGLRGGGENAQALADTLGMDVEALGEALRSGSTLADVAAQQGLSVDAVVDVIVDSKTERIEGAVADGRITQEQADERLADLEERVTTGVEEGRPDRGERGPRGGDAPADA